MSSELQLSTPSSPSIGCMEAFYVMGDFLRFRRNTDNSSRQASTECGLERQNIHLSPKDIGVAYKRVSPIIFSSLQLPGTESLFQNKYTEYSSNSMKSASKKQRLSVNLDLIGKYTRDSDTTISDDQKNRNNIRIDIEEVELRQKHLMSELIESEKTYIRALEKLEDYVRAMSDSDPAGYKVPLPFDLQKDTPYYKFCLMVFDNIKTICEWHKSICLPALNQSLCKPQNLEDVFKKFKSVFVSYEKYFENLDSINFILTKHKSYFEEIKLHLDYDLSLSCIILKPLHRIMNYHKLLKEMLGCAEQANLLYQLAPLQDVIKELSKCIININNITTLTKLCDFEGDLRIQGKLLMHGPMMCANQLSKCHAFKNVFKDNYVFLFEKIMIFTVKEINKSIPELLLYYYKNCIQLFGANMEILCDSCDGSFIISSYADDSVSSNSSPQRYVCHPACDSNQFMWITTIQDLLQVQNDFQLAIVNPMNKTY